MGFGNGRASQEEKCCESRRPQAHACAGPKARGPAARRRRRIRPRGIWRRPRDRISKAAKSNDRTPYYYFASKEKLFRHVIEYCYADLVASEEALALDFANPRRALAELVAFNWNYYWEKPELLSILASENLFKGRHVKNSIRGIFANSQLGMLDRVLSSGAERGDFKPDCDRFRFYVDFLANLFLPSQSLHAVELSAYRSGRSRTPQGMAFPRPGHDRRFGPVS